MAIGIEERAALTVGDLYRRFGAIPFDRIRTDPPPGTATEADLVAIDARGEWLCELVDGILVEKTVGAEESYLAGLILTFLNVFVRPRRLGFVYGADGLMRLNPDLVRIPDVSFVSRRRTAGGRLPKGVFCTVVPSLAVEVLSAGNTKKEMAEKLVDYFEAGVELVWYVDIVKKTVRVYTSPTDSRLLRERQTLDGGAVLPGFALPLRELFADPDAADA